MKTATRKHRKASAILRAALRLLRDGKCWTTGIYARNRHGGYARYDSRAACQWCAYGAIKRCGTSDAATGAAMLFARANRVSFVVRFNDSPGRTFADISRGFKKAIKLAEREEKKR